MPRLNQRLGFTRYEADEYYKRALESYRKNDFDSAIDAMTDAIDALPGKSEYLAARGLMYLEDGEIEKAEADFEQALRHYAYEMLAHYGRGMIAYKAKDWDAALTHFVSAQRIEPARPETAYYLALTLAHKRQFADAAAQMAHAQQIFEQADDRRKADAARWLRELTRQAERPPTLFDAGAGSTRPRP